MIRHSPKRTSLLIKLRALLHLSGAKEDEITKWMRKHVSDMHNSKLRTIVRGL